MSTIVIIGSGLKGLLEANRLRHERPDADVRIVGRAPQPGGSVRTLRIEGYSCELGPEGYRLGPAGMVLLKGLGLEEGIVPLTMPIQFQGQEPEVVRFLLRRIFETDEGPPVSLRSGCEDLVQALRRVLTGNLMSGRPVTAIRKEKTGFNVLLGGQVERTLVADEVVLALPPAAAGALVEQIDQDCSDRLHALRTLSFTNVYFGLWDHDAREALPTGSFLQQEDQDDPFLAALDCTQLLPGRTSRGKALVRIVLNGALLPHNRDPDALADAAEKAFRGYTGVGGPILMRRVMHTSDVLPVRSETDTLAGLRAQIAHHEGLRLL